MGLSLEQTEVKEQDHLAKDTSLRHAIEGIISHMDNDLVVTVFLYDQGANDLVPFACKGVAHDKWVLENTGKHQHGFVRRVFDNGKMTSSINIQDEPNAVNRLQLGKQKLMGFCGTLLMSGSAKYGVMCVMSRRREIFNLSQRARCLWVAQRISGHIAEARRHQHGKS